MKEQPEPRFRNASVAQLYLGGLAKQGQTIELHETTATGPGGPQPSAQLFLVTLNGALIGRGLTIDQAVGQAEEALEKSEFLPGLF